MKFDWVTNRFDISNMAWPHLYNAEMIIDIWSKWVAVTFIVIIKLCGVSLSVYSDEIELVHRCDKHVHHDLHIHWEYMLDMHVVSACIFIEMDMVPCHFAPARQGLFRPLDVVWTDAMKPICLAKFNFALRPCDAYMYHSINHHRFRWWLVAWSTPSRYLQQYLNIVNWILGDKLQWNFDRNLCIFIQKNATGNVFGKMEAILSRHQCVKTITLNEWK